MTNLRIARVLALAALCGAGLGCKRPPPVSAAPLTAEAARAFDHGVDFVAALGGLEGRWRSEYDADLDQRAGTADLIAIVTIDTVHSDTDPEQRVNHRLVGPVTRVIYGSEVKELELTSHEDDPGYDTVHDSVARFPQQSFIAYVKWYRDVDGSRAAHFHLSPAAEEIISQTESRVALRDGAKPTSGEQVIVHNN
jgi:hypothetical protein